MSERKIAQEILKSIGGEENIKNVEHCATRLRLVLKDETLYNNDEIEAIDGVKGQFFIAGQHQIILGTGLVNKVYAQIVENPVETSSDAYSEMNAFQKVSRILGDVFVPIIPVLVATGLFMGVRGLLINLGVEFNPLLLTLSQVLIDTAFAFLPALVGYSTMKRFGGSPILGIVIGLMLVAPQLPNANQVASGTAEPLILNLFGFNLSILGYQGSILPALMLTTFAAWLEKKTRSIVPDVFDLIVTPFVTLLISLVVGLFIIGPAMHEVEFLILAAVQALMGIPFGIGGFVIGFIQQLVVVTGLHHTFKALEIELLASTGANPFNMLASGAIVSQAAATIAVAIKLKDPKKRSLSLTSAVPAFFGITEPAIFGVNLPRLKPFLFGCVGGGVAGMFSSLVGLAGTGMSITAIPGMLLYLDGQLTLYIIACLIGFAVSFGLTFAFYNPNETK